MQLSSFKWPLASLKQRNSIAPMFATQSSASPYYASIDIGSHNVRMDLFQINAASIPEKVEHSDRCSFSCNLAEGLSFGKEPKIKRKNLAKAVEALQTFEGKLSGYNVDPRNVCIVMTEAVRRVEKTSQGQEDIETLASAFKNRPFAVLTGEEESILVGEAVKLACAKALNNAAASRKSVAFAALGGGSLEIGRFSFNGEIENAVALPYGIHPLLEKSNGQKDLAQKILRAALKKDFAAKQHDILIVTGGNWRTLGNALALHPLPVELEGRAIKRALTTAAKKDPAMYRHMGDRIEKRAAFLPMAATALLGVSSYLGAKKIIFSKTTTRMAMAHQMYGINERGLPPTHGLQRVFAPIDPPK